MQKTRGTTMDTQYYDGTKLLSMKDINGNTPEIFMCTSNRSAGKTTYFERLEVNRFLKNGSKFGVVYRFNYELDDCAEQFFGEIQGLFFNEYEMLSEKRAKGVYHELFIRNKITDEKKSCGYAMALNNADVIKRKSHLLNDITSLFFDEFQSETNHYCDDEVKKFLSLHKSLARGGGKQVKYLPVYMVSNPVTIINPYYVKMGISSRLTDEVNFLRGDGFVLEKSFNESASEAIKSSGVSRAFADDPYIAYSAESVYLNDNISFIETPPSTRCKYLATIRYEGKNFAIKEYRDSGIVYCDDKPDNTFPYKLSVTLDDHTINYVMLKNNDMFISNLRWFFQHGSFRFKDIRCKEALLKCISY